MHWLHSNNKRIFSNSTYISSSGFAFGFGFGLDSLADDNFSGAVLSFCAAGFAFLLPLRPKREEENFDSRKFLFLDIGNLEHSYLMRQNFIQDQEEKVTRENMIASLYTSKGSAGLPFPLPGLLAEGGGDLRASKADGNFSFAIFGDVGLGLGVSLSCKWQGYHWLLYLNFPKLKNKKKKN